MMRGKGGEREERTSKSPPLKPENGGLNEFELVAGVFANLNIRFRDLEIPMVCGRNLSGKGEELRQCRISGII